MKELLSKPQKVGKIIALHMKLENLKWKGSCYEHPRYFRNQLPPQNMLMYKTNNLAFCYTSV